MSNELIIHYCFLHSRPPPPPTFLLNSVFIFRKHTLWNSFSEGLWVIKILCLWIFLDLAVTLCSEYWEVLPRFLFRSEGLVPWAAGTAASWQNAALSPLKEWSGPRSQPLPLSAHIQWLMSQVYKGWAHLPQLRRDMPGSKSRPSVRLYCRPILPSVQYGYYHPFLRWYSQSIS